MPKIAINFREMHEAGGTLMERINPRALAMVEASEALNCQLSGGVLEKALTWQRLSHITVTGYALLTDGTVRTGAYFHDHADYDLGLRWTIDITYKATSIPGSGTEPIHWRADTSNNKITALEINSSGQFVFTHRDSNGTEKTLTSAHTISAGDQAQIRVSRFNSQLQMWIDRKQSASRNDLSATYKTAPTSNDWHLNVGTVTNGNDPAGVASCDGVTDEFRVWRDSHETIDDSFAYTEWPWLGDPRLVLYARLNDDSFTDYSKNGNDGTVLESPTTNATALVTAIAPILKLFHVKLTSGEEQWMVFTNGSVYAVDVT